MMRFISFGALALIAATSGASTRREDRADSLYISLANNFPYVGRVSGAGGGSGTLIAPNWVLTAGHVFSGGTTGSVRFGSDVYNIAQVIEFQGWDLGKNDLALCRLATPVTNISPVRMWNGGGEVGKVATSVGFGTSGTGLTGNTGGWGTKRAFQNVIDGYNEVIWGFNYYGLILDFDKPDSSVNTFGLIGSSSTALDLEGCGTPGDSGGGLFINVGGEEFLVGVTSYVAWEGVDPWAARPSNLYGYYGDNNGYSSVREAQNWITSNSGIQMVPEPGTIVFMATGAVALLARKRRRPLSV
jgi:hypothetical protein